MNEQIPACVIVIPAFNPGRELLSVLTALRKRTAAPVLLVNDGSAPACAGIFERALAFPAVYLLEHAENMGKGRALKDAFQKVLHDFPDCSGVVTADSDGQHLPEDICRCITVLLKNPESVVLGVRDFSGEKIPWKSRLGNRLTLRLWRKLFRVQISDTQTGLRGIPVRYLAELAELPGERYEYETRALAVIFRRKIPVLEVPIRTVYLPENRTSFRAFSDSFRICRTLFDFLH